jgi:hypothetical protein
MASGDDLMHPEKDAERERSIRRRAASSTDKTDEPAKLPKVEMKVSNADGELIRTQKFAVHQGVNRIVWAMDRDGVRPMPGPLPAELEDGLPGGIEVPAGEYEITLSLSDAEGTPMSSSRRVLVVPDPRSGASTQARLENYRVMRELDAMQEAAVTAVERVVNAQADVATAQALIKQEQESDDSGADSLMQLGKQAAGIQEELVKLENLLRVPPNTRGNVYDDDKSISKISMARYYVGSSKDAPSETAEVYIEQARESLNAAIGTIDNFMNLELQAFRQALAEAGIGLFTRSVDG